MGQIMRRLNSPERWPTAQVGLRSLGLALLALCVGVSLLLYHLVHEAPPHEPYVRDFAIAIVAFLTGSNGSVLLIIGPGLFAPVDVPGRQPRYPAPEGKPHE